MSGPLRTALVEDDPIQRRIVSEYLALNGLRPQSYASGTEFKRAHADSLPDLALFDVHLGRRRMVSPWPAGRGPAPAGSASSC